MNILIVNMSIDPVSGGGVAERTRQLAIGLQKLPDTDAKVLSTTAGLYGNLPLDHTQCVLLPCLNARWYLPAPYFGKVYRSIKWADVIIMINHWTLINIMVYLVNKCVKRPYLFCPAGALHMFGRSTRMKRFYNAVIGTRMLHDADAVIAIPHDEGEYFCQLGIPRDRIACIPNGITAEDFTYCDTTVFREQYQLDDAPFLLFMGRLNEIKGPDILLKAFVDVALRFPSWHLVMAGSDEGMKSFLSQIVYENGLDSRVHLIGFVSGKEKSGAYHAADILVVPSRLEAMSIVALEAGFCGTAVVLTDQCGFPEMVEVNAAVEVRANVSSLGTALCKLMSEPNRIQTMGTKAKHFISKNYTWGIAASKHRQLCEDVCLKRYKG